MASRDGIPDAWDDDYEIIADSKSTTASTSNPPSLQPKISRAERKAQHEQANKQLWESAENPEPFHFVDAKSDVPLKSDFKPALKVLSRKPQPANPGPGSVANGVRGLSLQDDEDDSEEEARKAQEKSLAERQQKAAREREEKQRKYAEVRERLFGSGSGTPTSDGRDSPTGGPNSRSRPRGGKKRSEGTRGSQPGSSADQSPARGSTPARQLFDPNEPAKPRPSSFERRGRVPNQEMPIRSPRGPDGSGRGGFGFAPRGNKTNAT